MGKLGLIIIFIVALIVLIYYVILLITGKRIASFIKSKDRFIWRGLKNISDREMPFSRKRNTIFLDRENLVITDQGIFSIYSELSRTGGLENAVAIPLHRIVNFDYKRRVADWNIIFRFILTIWNHLLKVNDFNLYIRFVDEDQEIKEFKFKANSLDIQDFEVAFADFDNEIYSGKVKWDSENPSDEILTHVNKNDFEEDTPVFKENKPTKKVKKQKEPKETLMDTKDETVVIPLPSDDEVGLGKSKQNYQQDSVTEEEHTISLKDSLPIVEDEPVFEDETVEVIDEDEQTVTINQEEFIKAVEDTKKKEVLFERPENYNDKNN